MTHTVLKKLLAPAAAFAMLGSPLMTAAPAAHATPTNCTYSIDRRDVTGTCKSCRGEFRIHLDCAYAPDRFSTWGRPGQQRTIKCLVGQPRNVMFEVRN